MNFKLFVFSIAILFSQTVFAYSSTMMNGDILKEDNYNINADLQYLTDADDNGFIVNGRFDIPFTEDMNLRGVLGFGEVDFHVGGYLKWMPIPDYGTQPAMGFLTGLHYANFGDINEFSIRIHPYMSKTFDFSIGELSPYAALPISLSIIDGETEIPVQFQLGTELKIRQLQHIAFIAELGIDVAKSFTYFSIGATFHFDSNYGMVFN